MLKLNLVNLIENTPLEVEDTGFDPLNDKIYIALKFTFD